MSEPGSTIAATTRYCAVYGHPIKHSASPAMQNAGLAALGLNWRYRAFAVHPNDLRAAIAGTKAMKFVGLNLTVPHKLLAMNMMKELGESGKLWGAVNTIRFVYDMIYRPAETPLLKAAKSVGCQTANGLSMLLYQGAKALEIWSGQPAPLQATRRALTHHVYG